MGAEEEEEEEVPEAPEAQNEEIIDEFVFEAPPAVKGGKGGSAKAGAGARSIAGPETQARDRAPARPTP